MGGVWQGRGGVALLQGLILFSFCRRLQNHTRITSFSMLSCSAISMISSDVGFWFWGTDGTPPRVRAHMVQTDRHREDTPRMSGHTWYRPTDTEETERERQTERRDRGETEDRHTESTILSAR